MFLYDHFHVMKGSNDSRTHSSMGRMSVRETIPRRPLLVVHLQGFNDLLDKVMSEGMERESSGAGGILIVVVVVAIAVDVGGVVVVVGVVVATDIHGIGSC